MSIFWSDDLSVRMNFVLDSTFNLLATALILGSFPVVLGITLMAKTLDPES